jgi:leucyl-tRNA synthetase
MATKEEVLKAAMSDKHIVRHIEGKKIVKVIYVPDKLLNIITEESK